MNNPLDLPFETILILGAGYMAYRIAYDGMRNNHKPMDVTFLSVAFGLVTKATMIALSSLVPNQLFRAIPAVVAALLAAAIWRKWGKVWLLWFLRKANISYSNALPSAFDEIRTSTSTYVTQVAVQTNSGELLLCDDLLKFAKIPFGPCIFGEDGSIALFVTNIYPPDSNEATDCSPIKEKWGSKITFIPANNVKSIEVRSVPR